ncbi:MAG: phosphodiester glycosidase family protein [Akkermansiaceae bacterium]
MTPHFFGKFIPLIGENKQRVSMSATDNNKNNGRLAFQNLAAISESMSQFIAGITLFLLLVSVSSCYSPPKAFPQTPPTNSDTNQKHPPALPQASQDHDRWATEAPAVSAVKPRVKNQSVDGIRFSGVEFDTRTHRLLVADQKNGPGTRFSDARDAASKMGGIMAINAGFFTPEGKPLGLVISDRKKSGSWNSASSLGTGIYRLSGTGSASIARRTNQTAVTDSVDLLQSGPLLIENGSFVKGLNNRKTAIRSFIVTDGDSRWWVGRSSACTLRSLAIALCKQSPTDWNIAMALNLDGGRSSDLYVSNIVSGGPVEFRGILNRSVRNFLVLKSR